MTELEPRRQQPLSVLPPATERASIWNLAQQIADTDFIPKGLRGKPHAIMAAMLTGREMGIGPMRALRQVQMIEGKPTPAPELMMALALRAGHSVDVIETSHERCTVRVHRSDWREDDHRELAWTLDDAERAGLCRLDAETGRPIARSQQGNPLPWEQYPRAMLRSRAVSEACRAWLPDVVEGASYTPEELGAPVDAHGHGTEVAEAHQAQTGQPYDPLEGEPAEVRARIAAQLADAGEGEAIEGEVVSEGTEVQAAGERPEPEACAHPRTQSYDTQGRVACRSCGLISEPDGTFAEGTQPEADSQEEADGRDGIPTEPELAELPLPELYAVAGPALTRLHKATRGRQPYGKLFTSLRDDLQGDPRKGESWQQELPAEAVELIAATVGDLQDAVADAEAQQAG